MVARPVDPYGAEYAYVQVAKDVERRITEGEITAKLPSERSLAEDYGVAYTTVRRAMELLRERSVIITVHGRGTFVKRATGRSLVRSSRATDSTDHLPEQGQDGDGRHGCGSAARADDAGDQRPVGLPVQALLVPGKQAADASVVAARSMSTVCVAVGAPSQTRTTRP